MADKDLERLKLLYDYEKFHIGLYGAMMAGFITVLKWSDSLEKWMIVALVIAILLLLLAALCGATLASSVIDIYNSYRLWQTKFIKPGRRPRFWGVQPKLQYQPPIATLLAKLVAEETNLSNFWKGIGPFKCTWFKPEFLWAVGHTAFWGAVAIFICTFGVQTYHWTKPQAPCQCIELKTTTTSGAKAPINSETK
jgi:hypothetical protein